MSNFDIAREATEAAYNSDGSAEKELKNFQKGIEYSLTTFKAQFQELSTTFLNADIFKGLIDGGTQFLNILTKILDVGGGLPAMLGTLTAIMGSRGHGKQKVIVFNALSYKIA